MVGTADAPLRVLDWDAVARYIVEHGVQHAAAGLLRPEGRTHWLVGDILEHGRPVREEETYVPAASLAFEPALFVGNEAPIPLWVSEAVARERWPGVEDYASLYWPESSLRILRGEKGGTL